MASGGAQMEVERRLRDVAARFVSLPESNKELQALLEVSAPANSNHYFFLGVAFAVSIIVLVSVDILYLLDKVGDLSPPGPCVESLFLPSLLSLFLLGSHKDRVTRAVLLFI